MSKLVFVNPTAEAAAVGISSTPDLVVFASVNDGHIRDVHWFANESVSAFRGTPYWDDWKKNVTIFDDKFNFNRALYDVARGARWIAHDPEEASFPLKDDETQVSVSKEMCEEHVGRLNPENALSHFINHRKFARLAPLTGNTRMTELDPRSPGAMVKYFWDSLRTVNDRKTFASPMDRPDVIYAIVRAMTAEYFHLASESKKAQDHAAWCEAGCPGDWPGRGKA